MNSSRHSFSAYCCWFFMCSFLWGADFQLETVRSFPNEISEQIRKSLNSQGVRVLKEGKVVGEFWFPREISTEGEVSTSLGVSFGQVKESVFLGIARFPENWSDYRGRAIVQGTYTLRYGIQPADGNHMGVTYYRDFLLLLPISVDSDPDAIYSREKLVDLSTQASGRPHPTVLSLFPVYEEIVNPKLLKNDLDQWTIAIPFQSLNFGLVIEGTGE